MEITIEITRECSLNCIICSSNAGHCDKNELTTEEWLNVINQSVEIGANELSISGGEPFLRSDIFKITEYAKASGLSVVIYSSGNVLDALTSKIRSLNKHEISLVSKHIDRLALGLHGSDAETHDIVTRVEGSFARLIETVHTALNHGIIVTGHFVPTKLNYRRIREVISIAMNLGLSKLGILRFVSQGRGAKNQSALELNEKEMNEFVHLIKSLNSVERDFVKIGAPFKSMFPERSSKCSLGKRITIQPNGMVAPCEALKDYANDTLSLNIRNSSLKEILHSNWIDDIISQGEIVHHCETLHEHCVAQILLQSCKIKETDSSTKKIEILH